MFYNVFYVLFGSGEYSNAVIFAGEKILLNHLGEYKNICHYSHVCDGSFKFFSYFFVVLFYF